MKLQVTFDDGDPTQIIARTEHLSQQPMFIMEGSTAVFIGPAVSERVESAADAVEQLPFVQAVEVGE